MKAIIILSGQKDTFLRRKREFLPKKIALAFEGKSGYIRWLWPTLPYISADAVVCVGRYDRMCFWKGSFEACFNFFEAVFCPLSCSFWGYLFVPDLLVMVELFYVTWILY